MAILYILEGNAKDDQKDAITWVGVQIVQQEMYHFWCIKSKIAPQHLTSVAICPIGS